MKTITIVVPTYNEEANIMIAYNRINETMQPLKNRYNIEILFVDNDSKDSTRTLIRNLCKQDKSVKAIFNARNFGQARRKGIVPFYYMPICRIHQKLCLSLLKNGKKVLR